MLRYRNRMGSDISRRSWETLFEQDGYQSVALTEIGDRLVATTWVGVFDDVEDDDAYAFVTAVYRRTPSPVRVAAEWWKPISDLVPSASEAEALVAHRRALAEVA